MKPKTKPTTRKRKAATEEEEELCEYKYVPLELWTLIFPSLPVKTLLRFRTVCKSWQSVIDHPDFVSLHRPTYAKTTNKLLVLARKESGDQYGSERYSLTVVDQADMRITVDHIFSMDMSRFHTPYIIGSCNGLLLVQFGRPRDCPNELRLWNPFIRKSLPLPTCPILVTSYYRTTTYAFGFAPMSNDFKVFAIDINGENQGEDKKRVAVYTLSDRRWTVNEDGLGVGNRGIHRMFSSNDLQYLKPLVLRGTAYWFGNHPFQVHYGSHGPTHLVSLNFDTEKFDFLGLPQGCNEVEAVMFLFVLGESPAIFRICCKTVFIWVLEKGEWTLGFSGSSTWKRFQIFKFFRNESTKMFYHENGDAGCVVFGGKSYDIAKGKVKVMKRLDPLTGDELEAYSDQSSLLWKGYGARDLESDTKNTYHSWYHRR